MFSYSNPRFSKGSSGKMNHEIKLYRKRKYFKF